MNFDVITSSLLKLNREFYMKTIESIGKYEENMKNENYKDAVGELCLEFERLIDVIDDEGENLNKKINNLKFQHNFQSCNFNMLHSMKFLRNIVSHKIKKKKAFDYNFSDIYFEEAALIGKWFSLFMYWFFDEFLNIKDIKVKKFDSRIYFAKNFKTVKIETHSGVPRVKKYCVKESFPNEYEDLKLITDKLMPSFFEEIIYKYLYQMDTFKTIDKTTLREFKYQGQLSMYILMEKFGIDKKIQTFVQNNKVNKELMIKQLSEHKENEELVRFIKNV